MASLKSAKFTANIPLSPKKLLEISEEINRKYTPKINANSASFIVLPIDPGHLYVSWNISLAQMASALKDGPQSIVLRIYPKPDETPTRATKKGFDVDLDQAKTRQKVMVPMEHRANSYTAAIGIRDQDNQLTALATSNAIHTPRANMASYPSGDIMVLPIEITQSYSSKQDSLLNTRKNFSGQGKP